MQVCVLFTNGSLVNVSDYENFYAISSQRTFAAVMENSSDRFWDV